MLITIFSDELFAEFHRLLKAGGVVVVLTTCKLEIDDVIAKGRWEPRERRQVFVGGLKAHMHSIAKG